MIVDIIINAVFELLVYFLPLSKEQRKKLSSHIGLVTLSAVLIIGITLLFLILWARTL